MLGLSLHAGRRGPVYTDVMVRMKTRSLAVPAALLSIFALRAHAADELTQGYERARVQQAAAAAAARSANEAWFRIPGAAPLTDRLGNVVDRSVTDTAPGGRSQSAPIVCSGLIQGVYYHAADICAAAGAKLAGDLGKRADGSNRDFDGRYFVTGGQDCAVGLSGFIADKMSYTLHFRCVDASGATVPAK